MPDLRGAWKILDALEKMRAQALISESEYFEEIQILRDNLAEILGENSREIRELN